jgi:hypothetical protein
VKGGTHHLWLSRPHDWLLPANHPVAFRVLQVAARFRFAEAAAPPWAMVNQVTNGLINQWLNYLINRLAC